MTKINRLLCVTAVTAAATFQLGCSFQRQYDKPELAVSSLVNTLMLGDDKQLIEILGSDAKDLIFSGDPVQDDHAISRFISAYNQKHALEENDDGSFTLSVGDDEWPLPIPIVKNGFTGKWSFDTEAGKDEIISRRVGRNELNTIQVCLAYVDAQREYAQMDPQKAGMPVYAEKVLSDQGMKNGLYWEAKEGEPESPLGEFAAEAEEEGYAILKEVPKKPRAFHGYYFRILKAQGPKAPGGERDYIVNGKMIGGFAMIACPANYGVTGVKTFIINQDGVIYEADLGKNSVTEAAKITSFNPDEAIWNKVDEQDCELDEATEVAEKPKADEAKADDPQKPEKK